MATEKYTAPKLNLAAFHCPQCGVYSKQEWENFFWIRQGKGVVQVPTWRTALCSHCNLPSLWRDETMVFPASGNAPLPNPDIPEDIRADFNEARSIANTSPRGAAALLRLCIQKLCKKLGEKGENINDDIANLVKKGLPASVQRALDAVRVIGNEAVHPGTIDLQDNPEMVASLFSLVNFIAEKEFTEPKEIKEIYAMLPEDKRKAIEKRDK